MIDEKEDVVNPRDVIGGRMLGKSEMGARKRSYGWQWDGEIRRVRVSADRCRHRWRLRLSWGAKIMTGYDGPQLQQTVLPGCALARDAHP